MPLGRVPGSPALVLGLVLVGAALVAGQLSFPQAASAEQKQARDRCFCQLEGQVDDCECNVDTVDFFNNVKIFPRLQSLLVKDFFRFYKVNLKRPCPFWEDDGRCSQTTCRVKCCNEDELPIGLKAGAPVESKEDPAFKYTEEAQTEKDDEADCDGDSLGDLNTTISASRQKRLDRWTAHDDAQDNFCDVDDESSADMQFVDLLLNPERFTGYRGDSSTRVWSAIYNENCFKPKSASSTQNKYAPMVDTTNLGADPLLSGLCLEERVFYRAISGLHTSITVHLCADYLLSEGCRGLDRLAPGTAKWGPNPAEFHRRFDPETTYGQGPSRLKNLYFLYLLELRALAKAAPYLSRLEYFTGNEEEDQEVRMAIRDILAVISSFPSHFNESELFRGGKQARKLKIEFRDHFRNISRIMDCVGCEKCKLWGTLQTRGLGTALKILFSGNFDDPAVFQEGSTRRPKFQLSRNEIVALFNAFGRLSTSVRNLEQFRTGET
ncbi:ero1-like protein isoform X3 [Amphibalanus amphitrite]|nr:ero1-like protein isoform X3 [Amphibalanus amphitrite]XP_043219196.1 ero1-like protein isoform X3 [Amphibalanus amphitrite]XP_043219197.1 ero1-like protein isoform X3 [Amphibalanus amphitrite]XP_043219198.1 ero1-like protein isoform X3 [Amphibalanus amphitrite]XP_043219200.1 ero1-like protein isoform X3 [Amphibalanus amphitrite]XP_043219201.1 ero1-like protein isoform X3 [Amphibalanus amphitrite]